MKEYIEREAAIYAVCVGCCEYDAENPLECSGCAERTEMLKIPTADVVSIGHADWVLKHGIYVCSNCDTTCPYDVIGDDITYWTCHYCPHCGAKMDGGKI